MQLGVKRGTVRLVPYQPEWKLFYEQEKELLLTIFQKSALDIQHVGSTSIEGLSAKPIIDIAIKVQMLNMSSEVINLLTLNHYKERVNRLGSEQLVYVKGPEEKETYILHIIPDYNPDWNHKLQFRDFLRAHSEILEAYELLKRELSQQYINDRESYTKGKESFIKQVLSKG